MRSHTNKKSTQDSGATTVQASLKSCPFAPLAKPDSSRTMADVQAQLEHAQRYGHSLAKMSLSPRQPTPPMIQPKLTIGAPGDKYEQEADRVAQQVVQQINSSKVGNTLTEHAVQRENLLEEDELQMKSLADQIQRVEMLDEEDELQMKVMVRRSSNGAMPASEDLESAIAQARGSGQPLAVTIRQPMEQAFGADFSGVKVHTDSHSDRLNRSIQARAFTTGQDIFFSRGAYQPTSQGGQKLIAHELTHVVQQGQRGKSKVLEESADSDIQRKMRTDQLNVAGETHSESNPRRDEEKKFSKDRSGSPNYWLEQAFTVTKDNMTREEADSPYLRAVHIMMLMGTAGENAQKVAGEKKKETRRNATIKPGQMVGVLGSAETELRERYKTVDEEVQKVQRYTDRLQRSYKATGDQEIDQIYGEMIDYWKTLYENHKIAMDPSSKWKDMLSSLKEIGRVGAALKKHLETLEQKTNIKDAAGARDARSMAMMQGAAKEKGKRGTWKVGDLHITDMLQAPNNQIKQEVNIVTKQAFNDELAEWRKWQHREELVRQLMEKTKKNEAWKNQNWPNIKKLLEHYRDNKKNSSDDTTTWAPQQWTMWERAMGILLR
jgi:Domain of unknown function (DUF4157)